MEQDFTDQQLIENYILGDQKSFEFLVARYLNIIYNFVYKFTGDKDSASDITQETFIKVWKNIKNINKKNFKAWLFTVAKNTALDYLKKKKAIPFSSFATETGKNYLAESIKDHNLSPSDLSENKITKDTIKKTIKSLSKKYQEVLNLYYFKDLNFREISQETGYPINTIKSRHKRAIESLRYSAPKLRQ